MHIFTKQAINLFRIFSVIIIVSLGLSAQGDLDVHFIHPKADENNGTITLSIVNSGSSDISILKWNTPFEDNLNANIFSIQDENNISVPYIGRLIKRLNPIASDYITLQSGEAKVVTIELPRYYDLQNTGNYNVTYNGTFETNSSVSSKKINSVSLHFNILYISSGIQRKHAQKLPAEFNSCSQSQIDLIKSAHDEAINIAQIASSAMDSANVNTEAPRYNTWFGAPDSTRQSLVKTHFNNLYSALDTETISFDCSTCPNNEYASGYAYVYSSRPYEIYLCNAFWNAEVTGTDSRSGTIIHEMSHFTVVARTYDYAYGQSAAKNLAITNPNNAVNNADSHEYFAENTPFLAMDKNNPIPSISFNTNIDEMWISSIPSTHRKGKYARYYKFTLQYETKVVIDLKSSKDAYLYLLSGSQRNGTVLEQNDDGGTNSDSRITKVLSAGTYVIEATTYYSNITGSFSVSIAESIDAPTNVVSTQQTSNSVTLSWSDTSSNKKGFRIYNGNTLIATVSANTTSYTIENLNPNTSYTFTIKAYTNSGESTGVVVNVDTKKERKDNDIPVTYLILN